MADFAPGIKDKRRFGDLDKIQPKELLDFVIQRHLARRAGPHWDLRAGDPKRGLLSWVTRKSLPEQGKSVGVFRQPIHDYDYKDFEGIIPPGYGAGSVSKAKEGKILITKKDKQNVHFTTASTTPPKRYALIRPGARDWKHDLLVRARDPKHTGVEKPKFNSVEPKDIDSTIKGLGENDTVQSKIDGALALIHLLKGKDGLEVLSHRTSKRTGTPVVQTERFFGERPNVKVPKEYRDSVLLGELYGSREGKTIPPQELGGILNSSIAKSLLKQKDQNVDLKTMLFDVARKGKNKTDNLPYSDREQMIQELLKYLPKGKFHAPESVKGPTEGMKLINRIRSGKHPATQEGVVIKT
jgi:hypothetical protein